MDDISCLDAYSLHRSTKLCAMAVFVVWTCQKNIREQRYPHGPDSTGYQTTRTPKEDLAPTYQGIHGGRGCYPGCGPEPDGVEKKDNADP